MSEHFRYDNVERFPLSWRQRRRLRQMFAPPPRRSSILPTSVGIVLAIAICGGLAIGLGGSRDEPTVTSTKADPPILWNETQAVPTTEQSPEDAEWERRGSIGGGTREVGAAPRATVPHFGFCHVGGGANCVVDGDTFYHGRNKIRIANIDAPETHPPRCTTEARLGKEATARLHELLNSGEIGLSMIDRDRDTYGRKLRQVTVSGADVGDTLVGEGLARPYRGGRQPWC